MRVRIYEVLDMIVSLLDDENGISKKAFDKMWFAFIGESHTHIHFTEIRENLEPISSGRVRLPKKYVTDFRRSWPKNRVTP